MSAPVFGRLLTAMVTPMTFDGAVDLRRTGELAHKLVEEQNNDGIVVNGTTGESPTTTDVEKAHIVQAVVCLLYTSPSPRDQRGSRMPSSA